MSTDLSVVRESIEVFFQSKEAVASVDVNSLLVLFGIDSFVEQRNRFFVSAFVVALIEREPWGKSAFEVTQGFVRLDSDLDRLFIVLKCKALRKFF